MNSSAIQRKNRVNTIDPILMSPSNRGGAPVDTNNRANLIKGGNEMELMLSEEVPRDHPSLRSTDNLASNEVIAEQIPVPVVASVRRHTCGTGAFDRYWLNMDCCGLFCAGFTYFLHGYGCYAVVGTLLPSWFLHDDFEDETMKKGMYGLGFIHALCFCSVAILACINHFLAMTTNPGAVPPDARPLPTEREEIDPEDPNELQALNPEKLGRQFCRRCNSFKPARAHHCSICRRCVVKMDHHCPWVNNCVGIGNHKFFLLFIFYTFLSCCYSMSLLVYRFWICGVIQRTKNCHTDASDFSTLGFLALEAILFGLFTSCMMIDQYEVVTTNQTQIDRLKGEVHRHMPDVNEVFGGDVLKSGCRWDWLLPRRVVFPESIRNEVLGYCTPCMKVSRILKNKSDDNRRELKLENPSEIELV